MTLGDPVPSNDLAAQAAARLRAGEPRAAEALYRRMLENDGENAEILHRLAVLVAESGRLEEAIQLLQRAAERQPGNALLLNSLGDAYRQARKPAQAREVIRRALQIVPDYAEAFLNLGILHHEAAEFREAEECYRQAIVLKPKLVFAHSNLAELFRVTGRLVEARRSCLNAIDLDPTFAPAYSHLGNTQRMLGQMDEAVASCRKALELAPTMTDAHNNLAVALHQRGRHEEAEAHFLRAIALKPDFALAYKNLGGMYHAIGRLEEAEAACRKALALDLNLAPAYDNLGLTQQALGQIAEAEASFRRALSLAPGSSLTQWNYSLLKLLLGDYEQGLRLYEARFTVTAVMPIGSREQTILRALASVPRWQGEALNGKKLLVWSEQGLGDTVMALRYLPLLKARGVSALIVYAQPELARLVREACEVHKVFSGEDLIKREELDLHCPMMSLPFLFGTRLTTIPGEVPYLALPAEPKLKWRERLGKDRSLNVGIAWAGNKSNPRDRLRSIPAAKFAAFRALRGARFVSLQKGASETDRRETGLEPVDWMPECNDLLDTACLIDALDLVITVDTVIGHIAGALGKPVWLLNRFESEWRWLLHRDDSPWYPTMRVFRQQSRNDWDGVLSVVGAALERHVREHGKARRSKR